MGGLSNREAGRQPLFLLAPGPAPALASRPSAAIGGGALICLGFLASLLPCFWLLAIGDSSAPKCVIWRAGFRIVVKMRTRRSPSPAVLSERCFNARLWSGLAASAANV